MTRGGAVYFFMSVGQRSRSQGVITRGATVTECAPVIRFCCKGLFISMKTKSNAGGKMIRDMGK